jgi:hypothetical protein
MVALGTFIGLAALALGASALVLDPINYVDRSLHAAAHRRQALKPRSPAPTKTMAERRYLRQKRCLQSQQSSSTLPTAASSPQNVTDNVPQNVAPAPTTTTPDADQQPASSPTPTSNNGGNGNNSGSGSSSPPPSGGGDTYSGDLTFVSAPHNSRIINIPIDFMRLDSELAVSPIQTRT